MQLKAWRYGMEGQGNWRREAGRDFLTVAHNQLFYL